MIGETRVASIHAYTFFDPRKTYSFISSIFFRKNGNLRLEPLESKLEVAMLSRKVLLVDFTCGSYVINIENLELIANMLAIDMVDFDIILGMG